MTVVPIAHRPHPIFPLRSSRSPRNMDARTALTGGNEQQKRLGASHKIPDDNAQGAHRRDEDGRRKRVRCEI